jgi:hypothetical protein
MLQSVYIGLVVCLNCLCKIDQVRLEKEEREQVQLADGGGRFSGGIHNVVDVGF